MRGKKSAMGITRRRRKEARARRLKTSTFRLLCQGSRRIPIEARTTKADPMMPSGERTVCEIPRRCIVIVGRQGQPNSWNFSSNDGTTTNRIMCTWDEKLARNGRFQVTLGSAEPGPNVDSQYRPRQSSKQA